MYPETFGFEDIRMNNKTNLRWFSFLLFEVLEMFCPFQFLWAQLVNIFCAWCCVYAWTLTLQFLRKFWRQKLERIFVFNTLAFNTLIFKIYALWMLLFLYFSEFEIILFICLSGIVQLVCYAGTVVFSVSFNGVLWHKVCLIKANLDLVLFV